MCAHQSTVLWRVGLLLCLYLLPISFAAPPTVSHADYQVRVLDLATVHTDNSAPISQYRFAIFSLVMNQPLYLALDFDDVPIHRKFNQSAVGSSLRGTNRILYFRRFSCNDVRLFLFVSLLATRHCMRCTMYGCVYVCMFVRLLYECCVSIHTSVQ